jgi:hypothetical protein
MPEGVFVARDGREREIAFAIAAAVEELGDGFGNGVPAFLAGDIFGALVEHMQGLAVGATFQMAVDPDGADAEGEVLAFFMWPGAQPGRWRRYAVICTRP